METTTVERVRIIAADKHYQVSPFFVTPKFDDFKKVFITGQEHLSPEELKQQPFIISSDESYPIKHLMVLNPEVPVDRIMLNFLKHCDDIIAPSKRDVIPGKHRFYIENKEDEAMIAVKKSDLEYEANTLIRRMTFQEMSDFARLLGEPVKTMSPTQVEAALKRRAKDTPALIVDALNDKNRHYSIILNKLLDANILSKRTGGKYYSGEELIGVNELYAIEFLKDKNNQQLVSQWMLMITGKIEKSVPTPALTPYGESLNKEVPQTQVDEFLGNPTIVPYGTPVQEIANIIEQKVAESKAKDEPKDKRSKEYKAWKKSLNPA